MLRLALFTLLLGSLSMNAQDQDPLPKFRWAVIFRVPPANMVEPEIRISMLVVAQTEGQAATEANKQLYKHMSTASYEKLQYMEAQRKDP